MDLSAPNRRIIPPYLRVDQSWAIWVDGYTSDNPDEWVLMMGFVDYRGEIAPGTVQELNPRFIWGGTPAHQRLSTDDELTELKKMIGNVQRRLKYIPAVR